MCFVTMPKNLTEHWLRISEKYGRKPNQKLFFFLFIYFVIFSCSLLLFIFSSYSFNFNFIIIIIIIYSKKTIFNIINDKVNNNYNNKIGKRKKERKKKKITESNGEMVEEKDKKKGEFWHF